MILEDFNVIFAILFAIREDSSRTEHSDLKFYLFESTLSEEIVCVCADYVTTTIQLAEQTLLSHIFERVSLSCLDNFCSCN